MKLLELGPKKLPIWFMRQAGRYHSHYQLLRSGHDFETLCKNPKLACQVTLGPIEDFGFDAAILFSDLLFPLEYLGLGLTYRNGPPELATKLDSIKKIHHLIPIGNLNHFFDFQKLALEQIHTALKEKYPMVSLLGFVGSPWTLFAYAVEGQHAGNLTQSKLGLVDGRFDLFCEQMVSILIKNIQTQIDGKAECVCIFDTAAGELDPQTYFQYVYPKVEKILKQTKQQNPHIKIHFYAKNVTLEFFQHLNPELIDIIGVDWRMDMVAALNTLGSKFFIQGNIDPSLLFWPWSELEKKVKVELEKVKNSPNTHRWIFSLGHGVLPKTPVENVKKLLSYAREFWAH